MSYPFLANAQLLDEGTIQELDTLVTRLRTFLQVSHREDGTLYPQAILPVISAKHLLGRGSSGDGGAEPISLSADFDIVGAMLVFTGTGGGGGAPAPHHTTHELGGPDIVFIDASQLASGVLADGRLPANIQRKPVTEPDITLADVPTNNVTSARHGLAPKLPGTTTTFFRGDGTYAPVPATSPLAHAPTHTAAGSDPVAVTTLAGYPGGTANFLRADGAFASPITTDLNYRGGYVAGTYNDGDIVVAADGIAYLCTKSGITTPPEPWPFGTVPVAPHHATHEPGGSDPMTGIDLAWISIPYNAANFTTGGAMTWTVTAGNQVSFAYLRMGHGILLNIALEGTTIGGTPDLVLAITLPFTITQRVIQIGWHYNGSVYGTGIFVFAPGTNYVTVYHQGAVPWTADANTNLYLQVMLAI